MADKKPKRGEGKKGATGAKAAGPRIEITGASAARVAWFDQMHAAALRAPNATDGAAIAEAIEKQAGRLLLGNN